MMEKQKNTTTNESFIRWQAITISQLSYVINLIIVISVSALGFCISLLLNTEFSPTDWGKFFFTFSLFMYLLSTGLGILCNIIRLKDYRKTKNIVWKREKGISEDELRCEREEVKKLGNKTWLIFWWQVGLFCVATIMILLSIIITKSDKLF